MTPRIIKKEGALYWIDVGLEFMLAPGKEDGFYCEKCYTFVPWNEFQYFYQLSSLPGCHYFECDICAEKTINSYLRTCLICGIKYTARTISEPQEFFCRACYEPKLVYELRRVKSQLRRTQKLSLPSTLTLLEWLEILESYKWKCIYCGKPMEELDHIIPVSKGGGTTRGNCVPACHECNSLRRNNEMFYSSSLRPLGLQLRLL